MTVPVIAVALDRFGADVFASMRGWLSTAGTGPELLQAPLEGDPVEALEPQLVEVLLRATRAGAAARQGSKQVKIAAVCDAETGGAAIAARLATRLSAILRDRFAAIFDPRESPDQRNASLHIVARVPPLGATPVATSSLQQLAKLESWAPPPGGYPILARIWPVSPQTTMGTVSDRGLMTSVAVWLASLVASDDVESLERRFRHPVSSSGRVSMFAAATLSIPEGEVVEYARRRALYDALTRVAARASRPANRSQAEALVGRFPLDDWTKKVQAGAEAGEIRALAAERSGVGAAEEARIDVRPFDSVSTIRERNAKLLEPIAPPQSSAIRADVRLAQGLERLSAKESEALVREIEGALDEAFGDRLRPDDGLSGLPEVREALQLLHARVADATAADALGNPESRAKSVDTDPHRQAIEDALDVLPSPPRRASAALLVGLAAGLVVASLVASQVPPAAKYTYVPAAAQSARFAHVSVGAAAQTDPPLPEGDSWKPWFPWFAGGLLAAAAALGYAYWVASATVRPIRDVLRIRQSALAELRRSGGVGPTRRLLEREIDVRARRLQRGIAHAIDLRLRRLNAIVALVNDARDRASSKLTALHVVPASAAGEDDLAPLFPDPEPLHGHLIAPALLARWVAGQRTVVDPDGWATRLVTETWDASSRDGPCVDEKRVERACDDQVSAVHRTSMLSDGPLATEAAERVAAFVRNVAHSLGPPIRPRSRDGDVLPLHNPERVALVPKSEGDRVRGALKQYGDSFGQQEMSSLGPRLALICFWEDFAVGNLVYGVGAKAAEAG